MGMVGLIACFAVGETQLSHVLFVTRSDIILKMIGILTLVIILSTWTTAVPSFHTSNNKTDIQAKAKCMTVSGASKEELCVFPFIFTGKMYSNCTLWTFDTKEEEYILVF